MMGRISRVLWRPALLGLSAVATLYFAIAWATPYKPLNEILVAVTSGVCAVGAISFTPAALRILFAPTWPDRDERATLALWIIMTSVATNSVWALWWRLSDQPAFLVNNALYDGWRLGLALGIMVLVQAPNLIGRGVPALSRASYALAWSAAIALVLYLAIAKPDLDWLATKARPYLDNGVGYGAETP